MVETDCKVFKDEHIEVKLKKKDAHALGLLCYAESELQERMANYCIGSAGDSILDKIYTENAEDVCGVVFDALGEIIDDITHAMIKDAEAKDKRKHYDDCEYPY